MNSLASELLVETAEKGKFFNHTMTPGQRCLQVPEGGQDERKQRPTDLDLNLSQSTIYNESGLKNYDENWPSDMGK